MAFNIESVPNQAGKPAILLREAWREGKRIRKRTVANLSKFPPEIVEGFRAVLKGAVAVRDVGDLLQVERSLLHGHVAAVLGTARDLGLERILHRTGSRERDLALAAVVARVLSPDSKLATARRLSPETATSSLGALLGLGPVAGNEVLGMLDWLLKRQPWIERSLANRHLEDGTLVRRQLQLPGRLEVHARGLRPQPRRQEGQDADRVRDALRRGRLPGGGGGLSRQRFGPVHGGAPGEPDPQALRHRPRGPRGRQGHAHHGADPGGPRARGARLDLGAEDAGHPQAAEGGRGRRPGAARARGAGSRRGGGGHGPGLPRRAADGLPEPEAAAGAAAEAGGAPEGHGGGAAQDRGVGALGPAEGPGGDRPPGRPGREPPQGREASRGDVTDDGIAWRRRKDRIAAEARLDGVYVVRTSLDAASMGAAEAVEAYKGLAGVERAFRNAKSDLRIRPVYVYSPDHVRAHVFMCMLALHVEWHMRRRLAPMLFEDDDREGARARRSSPVEKAEVSESAKAKADTKLTPDGLPVHSFRTLLDDLSAMALNQLRLPGHGESLLTVVTTPTRVQKRAFELLGVKPDQNVPIRMTFCVEQYVE